MRPQVQRLVESMERKLRENDHKRAWDTYGRAEAYWFVVKLREEVQELEEAMLRGTSEQVMLEAADVCNFALFIHDLADREGEIGDP